MNEEEERKDSTAVICIVPAFFHDHRPVIWGWFLTQHDHSHVAFAYV